MVAGVPWELDTSIILDAVKKAKGRVSHVAKALDVSPQTIYRRMAKDPEIKEALDEARNAFDLTMLDAAENTLMLAISKADEDINNALKSTFFILNNKGEERGYSHSNNPNNKSGGGITIEDFKKFSEYLKYTEDNKGLSESSESDRSDVENKPSILN